MKLYAKKNTAQKYLKSDQILCNKDIKYYFICENYQHFLNVIKKDKNANYFEYISDQSIVPIFFDIEVYKDKHQEIFEKSDEIIKTIKTKLNELFIGDSLKYIILESHSESKKSYHIITRVYQKNTQDNNLDAQSLFQLLFQNVKQLKLFILDIFRDIDLLNHKIIDTSVYREGIFRTIYSSKTNENRPFIVSSLSDEFNELDSFICYRDPEIENNILDEDIINQIKCSIDGQGTLPANATSGKGTLFDKGTQQDIDTLKNTIIDIEFLEPKQKNLTIKDKTIIKTFIKKHYNYNSASIRDILIDHQFNCIIIALDDKYCHNVDREHKSNNQYLVIDAISSKRKCHDTDCKDYKYNEILMSEYPKELNEIIKNVLKINKQELELIDKAIQECKDYITENFDESIEDIQFDKNEMVFRGNASNNGGIIKMNGKCKECLIEHQITNTGYCLRCIVCKSMFPKSQLIPVDDRYKNLNNFWMNYSQLVNNGTVNININNTFYNTEEEFNCDVQLDNKIFNNKELTKLYNQVLDGHKVIKISELISTLENDFKYTNGEWYCFNGSIWKLDKESLEFRKKIVNLSQYFNRIQSYYENKKNIKKDNNSILVKNIKSLINKLHKPGFEDEIIKGAKMYYNDEEFMGKLNSKKHLLPFTNGVFDLLSNQFRKTKKDDYINLTVNYPYEIEMENKEVYKFLREVLPQEEVRDYVLKKMSECLNGDIPNTYFLMFIGDTGANGKSQLLNLMKLTMGDFGEKVEVTLLTRKRNNANEANSEKIKLLNKRFAFLSEPEDGEKINIGLLKELTGSEEIVARGLYQDSLSFVMEAKLFLACNELPEIKGEDTALWRRIRVVDFPSRFVDDPKNENEYKIDRTLPSRMREDVSWRQTFMKILISYYYREIKEPEIVKIKTNEYRQENNEFFNWCKENIKYSSGEILKLSDVLCLFLNKTKIHSKESSKFRKELERFIKDNFYNIKWEYGVVKLNEKQYKGWKDLCITEDF